MCASYTVKVKSATGIPFELRSDDFAAYDNTLFTPQKLAPAIRIENGTPSVAAMRFSLLPSWSKEPRVKFATHNARLESIEEKPTWKTVFVKRHALIPMSSFIEPIYEGKFAGNMVAFTAKTGALILAAAVWDEWVNKETGEVIPSFSIITYEPPAFVAGIGHDRCPIFLNEASGKTWLANTGKNALELKQFLIENRAPPELEVAVHRPLKAGWEKRRK